MHTRIIIIDHYNFLLLSTNNENNIKQLTLSTYNNNFFN